ncbi:MAG TPA: TIGR00730 family Rossman fold protein [Alphaproteobacteria bacterium]|jgi:uncharacterized protein (TIGR00730 family)|nr:TIGR00730 family Rossman fold protein [Alphaproteobacteria bacterium]
MQHTKRIGEPFTICIYCGSKTGNNPVDAASAEQLGALLARRDIRMVYGGGSIGLMGITARAAMRAGGHVSGIITTHIDKLEAGLRELSIRHEEASMHARKMRMFEMSDGFIALPGGSGTLDEIAEILSWQQLGLHQKPCALLNNTHYWDPLMQMLNNMHAQGFLNASGRDYFRLAPSVEAAVDYIVEAAGRNSVSRAEA